MRSRLSCSPWHIERQASLWRSYAAVHEYHRWPDASWRSRHLQCGVPCDYKPEAGAYSSALEFMVVSTGSG